MGDVAAAAGVSTKNVYKVFGNKIGLAKAVFDVAIAGDDEPAPMVERTSLMKVRDVLKRLADDGWIDVPMKYAIVIERGPTSYGATVPDLPGCVAVGASLDEVQQLIREAVDAHVAFLREEGQPIPEPVTRVDYVDVA